MNPGRRAVAVPPPPDAPLHLQDALSAATTDTARAAAYLALARHARPHSLTAALPLAQAALDHALTAGTPDLTVEALAVTASITVSQGRQEEAFEHLALALDLAHEHGLRHLEAQVRNNRAIARLTAGDLAGARRDLREAQALAQTARDALDLVNAHVNLAYLENLSGRHAEALHQLNLLEELLGTLSGEEQRGVWPYLHENRAHIYLNLARHARRRGRPDAEAEARARSHAAVQATREALTRFPDRAVALNVEAHAARLALLEGDLGRAGQHAEAALRHHHRLGQQVYLDAHLAAAEVSEARGHAQQAQAHYRAALDSARQQGRHREAQEVLQAVARLHEQEGKLREALATYREALESAQLTLNRLTQIERRNEDLLRELHQARAEASSWQESLRLAEEQAARDPLTGLLNRRGLQDALADLEGTPGTLLLALFDVDHFKDVNDQHSHTVGDAALQALAAHLTARVPPGSLLARYGGEEFLLVVPDVNPTGATPLAEELRRSVEVQAWPTLPPGLHLTVSVGYAVASERQPETLRAAFEQADEHLYRAKRAGRNRVYPPPCVPA